MLLQLGETDNLFAGRSRSLDVQGVRQVDGPFLVPIELHAFRIGIRANALGGDLDMMRYVVEGYRSTYRFGRGILLGDAEQRNAAAQSHTAPRVRPEYRRDRDLAVIGNLACGVAEVEFDVL